jgi:HAD superfamily hydrolase (TIGR01457 family)
MTKDLRRVKFFLLDLDGTFYLGPRLFPWSLRFMDTLKQRGKRHLFLTNNSSASRAYYAEKITNMGFETKPSEVFSSTTATIIYLKKHYPDARLYVLGTPCMEDELKEAGLPLVQDNPDIVLLGFDQTLTYEKLKQACYWLRAGKMYIATHPDINCPTENGPIPDIGSMIELLAASTERRPDIIIGKPYPPIIDALFEQYSYERDEVAMIGDRLYTDIQTGINAGIVSILVLSGETTREMYESWDGKADFVFKNIGEIANSI